MAKKSFCRKQDQIYVYSEAGIRENSDALHNNSIKWGNEFQGLMLHMGIESRFKADATELPVIDVREPGTIG